MRNCMNNSGDMHRETYNQMGGDGNNKSIQTKTIKDESAEAPGLKVCISIPCLLLPVCENKSTTVLSRREWNGGLNSSKLFSYPGNFSERGVEI